MYAEILAIFLSSTVEFLISGYLGLKGPKFGAYRVISIWFLIIPMLILPTLLIWTFVKSGKNKEDG